MAKKAKKKYTTIGGQALMEGIMMRGPHKAVMCVRRMDGSITSEEVALKKPTIWNKIPIIRGVVSFVSSMAMGTKMLMRSADLAIEDEENAARAEEEAAKALETAESSETVEQPAEAVPAEETECAEATPSAGETAEIPAVEETSAVQETPAEAAAASDEESALPAGEDEAAAQPTAAAAAVTESQPVVKAAGSKANKHESKAKAKDKKNKNKNQKNDSSDDMGFLTVIATVLGFGLAILLFFFLPTWAYTGLLAILPEDAAAYLGASTVWKSVIEGFIKLILFFGYMILISQMKEIKRLFQYHGAEHKTIFCYEAGEELTVENVRKYKRFHPRCGTSFIVLMLLVGVAAGICITAFLPEYDSVWIRPLIKLALIPLTMGVGYELLKLAGKHDNILTRIISAPGLWMQRISTKEPDDGQIECAIAALKPVIPENGEDMQ